jgi:hypothetical protein
MYQYNIVPKNWNALTKKRMMSIIEDSCVLLALRFYTFIVILVVDGVKINYLNRDEVNYIYMYIGFKQLIVL